MWYPGTSLCSPISSLTKPQVDVCIFNTNTERTIVETIEIDDNGDFQEDGNYAMPGLQGITGSEIKVAFVSPAGSMTGRLFPTGNPIDDLTIDTTSPGDEPLHVRATLLDAANPFVLVDASTLPPQLRDDAAARADDPAYLSLVESIRRRGAVLMGLADSDAAAARVRGTPKIALLWPASGPDADVKVRSFSMGKAHPSLQLTGAVCLGAGLCLPGTVPQRLAEGWLYGGLPTPARTPSPSEVGRRKAEGGRVVVGVEEAEGQEQGQGRACDIAQTVKIEHASGLIEVEVVTRSFLDGAEAQVEVERCVVSRTARRLFEGNVYFYL